VPSAQRASLVLSGETLVLTRNRDFQAWSKRRRVAARASSPGATTIDVGPGSTPVLSEWLLAGERQAAQPRRRLRARRALRVAYELSHAIPVVQAVVRPRFLFIATRLQRAPSPASGVVAFRHTAPRSIAGFRVVAWRHKATSDGPANRRETVAYLSGGPVSRPHPVCVRFTSSFRGRVGVVGRADRLRAGAHAYFGPRPRVGSGAGDKMLMGSCSRRGEALRPLNLSRPSTRTCRQRQFGSRPRRISVKRA
jgi:hypothetical protein